MNAVYALIHLATFAALLIAAFRIVPSFRALIRLHAITQVTGISYFLLAAITHLALAIKWDHVWVFNLLDYLQLVCILVFIVALSRDLQRALSRLRMAFMVVRHHYQKDGDRLIAMVTAALKGEGNG